VLTSKTYWGGKKNVIHCEAHFHGQLSYKHAFVTDVCNTNTLLKWVCDVAISRVCMCGAYHVHV